MIAISDLGVSELGGRRGALRSVGAAVAAVRRQLADRSCALPDSAGAPLPADVALVGSAGAADLLLGSVGDGEDVLRRTLRTVGFVKQRSLADYLE